MNRKIYLHIGFGKTGSSSLQSYLSFNPELQSPDHREKILFCCFKQDGDIVFGKELPKMAERLPLKYAYSNPAIATIKDLSKTREALDKIFSAGFTPLFSHEDWGRRSAEFRDSDFFAELDCSAQAIVYVRPQVEWLNSAWWQWFAWIGEFSKPDDVVSAWGYGFMQWGEQISRWKDLPGVESVKVRLYPNDIVADFISLFGMEKNPELDIREKINAGLSPTLIKLLCRFPKIRGPLDPEIDVILSRHLKFGGKSPWVIEKDLAARIISATRDDNFLILSMLDEQSKKVMENDRRWWDPEYYLSRHVCSKADLELDKQELLAILDQALPALRKVQSIRGNRWWDPDYYASRPLHSNATTTMDKQELLSIVDNVIPVLIRLESAGNETERGKQNAGSVAEHDRIPGSSGWENSELIRSIHHGLVNMPYYSARRIVIKIWQDSPGSTEFKQRVKHKLFSNLPWLFRWSKAYRRWAVANEPTGED